MKFTPHGNIEIKWLGNILVVKPSGSVNLEGADNFHELVNEQIAEKAFSHWGRIIDFIDDDTLATPDAYQKLQTHLKENIASGCLFLGLVGGNSTSIHYCERAATEAALPYFHFTDFASAEAYITNNIEGLSFKDNVNE
jgi:hypothetical protein